MGHHGTGCSRAGCRLFWQAEAGAGPSGRGAGPAWGEALPAGAARRGGIAEGGWKSHMEWARATAGLPPGVPVQSAAMRPRWAPGSASRALQSPAEEKASLVGLEPPLAPLTQTLLFNSCCSWILVKIPVTGDRDKPAAGDQVIKTRRQSQACRTLGRVTGSPTRSSLCSAGQRRQQPRRAAAAPARATLSEKQTSPRGSQLWVLLERAALLWGLLFPSPPTPSPPSFPAASHPGSTASQGSPTCQPWQLLNLPPGLPTAGQLFSIATFIG